MRLQDLRVVLVGVLLLGVGGCVASTGAGGDVGQRFDAVRVTVRVDDAGALEITSAYFTLEPVPAAPAEPVDSIGEIAVVDAMGRTLEIVEVPRPEPVSVIAEDGSGGEVGVPDTTSVLVPWPEDADRVSTPSGGVTPLPPAALSPGMEETLPPPGSPAAGTAGPTTVPAVQQIHNSGPSDRRYDFVLVGDGYGAAGQSQFIADAQRFSGALLALEPYRTFAQRINVWAVPTSGLSCAHGCSGIDRLICCDDGAAQAAARSAVPSAESVLVLVNSSVYGGSGGSIAVSYNGTHMNTVMLHELGHTLGLSDEYVYGTSEAGAGYVANPGPNCAAMNPPHWDHWLDQPGVGAFPGCSFPQFFRPTDMACLMRRNEAGAYCPICREHVALRIYAAMGGLIESSTPDAAEEIQVGDMPERFSLMTSTVGEAHYQWVLDFEDQGVDAAELEVTACTVEQPTLLTATVTDHTELVRRDPHGYTTDSVRWMLAPDPMATTDGCLPMCIGQSCDGTTPCCDASVVCSPVDREATSQTCCVISDAPCGSSNDCCGEMQCVDGACQCQPVGSPCVTHRECCGGAFCSDGVCAFS